MNNTKDVAKLLANRINQEHYILQYLNEIYYAGFKKGKEEAINFTHSSTKLNEKYTPEFEEWYAVHSGAEKLDIGTKEVLAYVKYESHAKELIKKYGGYGYYEKVNL